MLGKLLRFLSGQGGRQAAEKRDFDTLNRLAPLKASPLEEPPAVGMDDSAGVPVTSFVCREAVLDREQRVAAYEFMLRKSTRERINEESPSIQRVYDDVLLRNVQSMDLARLLGHRLAFVALLPGSLGNPLLTRLPPEGLILQLKAGAAQKETLAALPRLQELKTRGFQIAFDGFAVSGQPALIEIADFVSVDMTTPDADAVRQLSAEVADTSLTTRLLARNIESYEDFELCYKLGFHLFQGPFVTSRAEWTQPKLDSSRMHLCSLLNRIRKDADTTELVEVIRQDPIISFKLMRYINSAAGGLQTQAASIEQALVVLGRHKFYRWLTLLLFTAGEPNPRIWALMENSLVRARLMEELGREQFPRSEGDNLFVTGIFSLLDRLFGVPMTEALAQLHLPDSVQQTLMGSGPYSPYLALAVACEAFDQEEIARLARRCGLDAQTVNVAHVEALVWAQEMEQA